MSEYEIWLKNAKDEKVKEELVAVKGDAGAIEDRFFKQLAFGTGGMRGKLGAGTNRMNVYTVGRATNGFANYLLRHSAKKSVAVSYDSRHMSAEFARLVAEIMSAKGIEAYLFDTLMPTPVLSYAVRALSLGAGVMVTASHNPKEYNGYKVYNDKGCQITDHAADLITAEIEKCGYFDTFSPDESRIHLIGEDLLDRFIEEVMTYSLPYDRRFVPSAVYTPLNGTGNLPMQKLFAKMDVACTFVESQRQPDGDFTTCPYPNPEERDAFREALKVADKTGAELIIATDPDADRVGIAEREADGYRFFNGNETGVLMENYILSALRSKNALPEKAYVVKTIVTSPLAEKVAASYGVPTKNVLTGFKYIGETIDRCAEEQYLFGMEESYGYLVGTHVRDKDSVSAVMIILEMAAFYRQQGLSLTSALERLYEKFGYYRTALYSKYFEGKSGMEYMQSFTQTLREKPWREICGEKTVHFIDYLTGVDGLPKSDVLLFEGETYTLIVRPSGTEPKLKFYITAFESTEEKSVQKTESLLRFVRENV